MPHSAFDRLPKHLTISFPLWQIFGTPGAYSPYYDIDRCIREHAERGFNCIRIESGAGLIHDLAGNPRPPLDVTDMFGRFELVPRQQHVTGDGGSCDLLARLVETCESAKRHGVFLILSSWYYLHTYWYHKANDPICDELFAIPPHERFAAFANFWHYILKELEARGLDDTIAFVEICNECNDHPYLNGHGNHGASKRLDPEETAHFREEHEAALAFLKREHPQLLFAYDTSSPPREDGCIPSNADVYNFHSYYLWSIYNEVADAHPEWFRGEITPAAVERSREGRRPVSPDWYERVARFNDLDMRYLPDFEAELEKKLAENLPKYVERFDRQLAFAKQHAGNRPIVCGEGVSYICHKELLWEEHSDAYWELVLEGIQKYKEAGLWGTVIRTCCGTEDPSWTLCRDRLLACNRLFLGD